MKHFSKPALVVAISSFILIACNNAEKKAEPSTSDTSQTSTTKPDTTAQTQSQNLDAAKVAAGLYTVAKDSMGIRVLNVLYKPGDSSAMHSHPTQALYVIDGGKGEFTDKDGSKRVIEFKPGMAMILGGATHSVKNIGKTTLKAVLVEINRPDQAATQPDPKMDAAKVAPNLYKVLADSMNIRILMATYKPGASSAMHWHPDNAIYVLEGTKAEFTGKDGVKQMMTMDNGMVSIMPASQHSVKNVGNKTTKVVIFEVNRPQQ